MAKREALVLTKRKRPRGLLDVGFWCSETVENFPGNSSPVKFVAMNAGRLIRPSVCFLLVANLGACKSSDDSEGDGATTTGSTDTDADVSTDAGAESGPEAGESVGDGDGDGDGDAGCAPDDGHAVCYACLADKCCEALTLCAADEDCACVLDCLPTASYPDDIVTCLNDTCAATPGGAFDVVMECFNGTCGLDGNGECTSAGDSGA